MDEQAFPAGAIAVGSGGPQSPVVGSAPRAPHSSCRGYPYRKQPLHTWWRVLQFTDCFDRDRAWSIQHRETVACRDQPRQGGTQAATAYLVASLTPPLLLLWQSATSMQSSSCTGAVGDQTFSSTHAFKLKLPLSRLVVPMLSTEPGGGTRRRSRSRPHVVSTLISVLANSTLDILYPCCPQCGASSGPLRRWGHQQPFRLVSLHGHGSLRPR